MCMWVAYILVVPVVYWPWKLLLNGKKRKKKEGKLNERVNEIVSIRKTRKRVLQVSKIVKSKNKQNKLCHGSDRGKEKGKSLWGKNVRQENYEYQEKVLKKNV